MENTKEFTDLRRRIGESIKKHRIANGLTQEELANRVKIGWRHLQKIEAGEINTTLLTLLKIATTLNVDTSVLFISGDGLILSEFKFRVIDSSPISIKDNLSLDIGFISNTVHHVNSKFSQLKLKTESMALNVFEVIDFRMLSGFVGESLVSAISASHPDLEKKP